jgi:hypothetical protein
MSSVHFVDIGENVDHYCLDFLFIANFTEFESRSGRGVQHYMIKFVGDFRQVGGFLLVLRFPLPIKLIATI